MRFPIEGGRLQPPQEGDERTEQPLLLNPSDSDPERAPERHLEFATELEAAGVIRAVDDGSGGDDALGAMSINVYALNRANLVDRRAEPLKDIRLAINTIDNAIAALDDLPPNGEAGKRQLQLIDAQIERLRERLADGAEYLLLARQFAEPYLVELEKRLRR